MIVLITILSPLIVWSLNILAILIGYRDQMYGFFGLAPVVIVLWEGVRYIDGGLHAASASKEVKSGAPRDRDRVVLPLRRR
ncbi:MAG: hypothetical protein HY220_00295 [Candidatus Sungbacteria bacterium]|uniref:Uncharacterized protein n=1 Tax=Candidatus Sungiibacteriota bacterium TaxID=2750080 RepID=A0A9D6LR54_9BACT|nr:hypothetical protein [Candidatus Sungbacteria bacterium]